MDYAEMVERRDYMSNKKGRLFIVSAPSGTGKSTVISYIIKRRKDIALSISATTRPPRDGEKDGLSYHFVTRERFQEMIGHGDFFEYAEYVGEFYGTPKIPIFECVESGKDIILEIEIQGAKQIMEKEPEAVSIFIVPPNMNELERRLRGRGTDSEDKLVARLQRAASELLEQDRYHHVIISRTVSQTAREIMQIIDNA